jgi:hypothetical protein
MLLFKDAGGQSLHRIILKNRYDCLDENRAGINTAVDKVYSATGKAGTVINRLLLDVQAGKRRQQGGVDVNHAIGERVDECLGDDAHEARQNDKLDIGFLQGSDDGGIEVLATGKVTMVDASAGNPGLCSAFQCGGTRVITDDNGNLGIEAVILAPVNDRLQIGPATRGEYPYA